MVTKIYANSVAKYNEGKLLDAEKLRRLIDAEFSDAVKMLCDYGYGGGALDEKSYDIDAFISAETAKLIEYAATDSPSAELTRVLTNRFLYGNAKAYYKARITDRPNPAAVYAMADADVRQGIEKAEYAALPPAMTEALAALDAEFSEKPADPKRIDIVLTRAMYADSVAAAKKSGNKALKAFVAGQIDAANILSALRARALRMREAALRALWIAGGTVDEDTTAAVFAAEDPAAVLADTPYGDWFSSDEAANLPQTEARIDDYLFEIWAAERENMLSFSPFVSYFTAQLAEYKTVKTILTCLKYNARDEIRSRLRRLG